jgi:hypothetical protein
MDHSVFLAKEATSSTGMMAPMTDGTAYEFSHDTGRGFKQLVQLTPPSRDCCSMHRNSCSNWTLTKYSNSVRYSHAKEDSWSILSSFTLYPDEDKC